MISPNPDLLAKQLQEAKEIKDQVWYGYLLKKGLFGYTLKEDEFSVIIDGSVKAAEELSQHISTTMTVCTPFVVADKLGLSLDFLSEEFRDPFLYFGMFYPKEKKIILNQSVLDFLKKMILQNKLEKIISPELLVDVILYHEIFHALEEITPGIFTRSRMRKQKWLGIFSYGSGFSGASEVGAVHFSKLMSGLHYSPCIYENLLLLGLHKLSEDQILPQ